MDSQFEQSERFEILSIPITTLSLMIQWKLKLYNSAKNFSDKP